MPSHTGAGLMAIVHELERLRDEGHHLVTIIEPENQAMKNVELKVKVASLAAEAIIIRRLQARIARAASRRGVAKGLSPDWVSLQEHRRGVIRHEARHSHLAYGFLRGTPYAKIEAKCWTKPDWAKVEAMAKRFAKDMDERTLKQRFAEWKAGKEPADAGV